jgi:hypothetical protein
MTQSFESLLQHPSLWRANGQPGAPRSAVPTGFPALDARLPGGGWPCPALIELLIPEVGVGELNLLIPLLRELARPVPGAPAQLTGERTLALLNPPFIPYAPALEEHGLDPTRVMVTTPLARLETLWATEQVLRSGACAAVLAWVEHAGMQTLRRLKLAANEGHCIGVLFRSIRCRTQPSPAHLRAVLGVEGEELSIELIKVQSGRSATLRVAL